MTAKVFRFSDSVSSWQRPTSDALTAEPSPRNPGMHGSKVWRGAATFAQEVREDIADQTKDQQAAAVDAVRAALDELEIEHGSAQALLRTRDKSPADINRLNADAWARWQGRAAQARDHRLPRNGQVQPSDINERNRKFWAAI
jgi:hypothetical protein